MPYAMVDPIAEERTIDAQDFTPTVSELERGIGQIDSAIDYFTKAHWYASPILAEAISGKSHFAISDSVDHVIQAVPGSVLIASDRHQERWLSSESLSHHLVVATSAGLGGVGTSLLDLLTAVLGGAQTTLSGQVFPVRSIVTPIFDFASAKAAPAESRQLAILSPAAAALSAVSDIQEWLLIGRDDVARLAGYAVGSPKNWQQGRAPYPATVRRLYDIHALLGSLVRTLGLERARLWLSGRGTNGELRRDELSSADGLRSVISEAADLIFERPSLAPVPDFDEDGNASEASPRPELFSGQPVRRVRRRI